MLKSFLPHNVNYESNPQILLHSISFGCFLGFFIHQNIQLLFKSATKMSKNFFCLQKKIEKPNLDVVLAQIILIFSKFWFWPTNKNIDWINDIFSTASLTSSNTCPNNRRASENNHRISEKCRKISSFNQPSWHVHVFMNFHVILSAQKFFTPQRQLSI